MDPFPLNTIALINKHTFLFNFKMTEISTCGLLDHPFFDGDAGLLELMKESTELKSMGEKLIQIYSPTKILKMKQPKKMKAKKFEQVQWFKQFLLERVEPDMAIFDIGSGVGHLTSTLSTHYSKITAIEKNPLYTNYPPQVNLLSLRITPDYKLTLTKKSTLIGLHSCGDLTPWTLRTFVTEKKARKLAIASCCYHKMTEMKPMSTTFKELNYTVGFLRLACQRKHLFIKNGINHEVNELYNRQENKDEKFKPKIELLLKSHNCFQRLSELVVMIDRLYYLQENNITSEIYNVLPLNSTPRGEMRVTLQTLNKLKQLLLNMPKERPHLPLLKAQRKMKKVDVGKYPPGAIQLQVLGQSVYLFTDQTRYLFNCGEGTQRLAHEHKVKLGKLDGVFVTSPIWSRVGGLPGVVLTVQDIGLERVNVVGPPGINRLFTSTRRFIILKDLEIATVNSLHTPNYSDHVLDINYINIHNGLGEKLGPCHDTDTTDYYHNYRVKHGEKMISVTSDESVLDKGVVTCYGVHLKKKEGTLLIDKCVERGVPAGPLLGQLKSGKDVTLPNGTIVRAEDVRSSDCPGPVFLVLDCPTMSHLQNLITNDKILQYTSALTQIVVHFTPLSILLSDDYRNFMQKFQISTQHLLINEDLMPDGNEAVHRMQTKLNLIDEELFPMLNVKKTAEKLDLGVLTLNGETGMKFGLRGQLLGVEIPAWTINHPNYRKEMTDNQDFLQELAIFKQNQKPVKKTHPIVTFLGTGSSIPAKTRNVSGIVITFSKDNSMLLDCGEGTLLQLQRLSNYAQLMSSLKTIYISHLHADHHLGLFSFLTLKKVKVIAPKQIRHWLESYSRDFEPLNYELIDCAEFFTPKTVNNVEIKTCYVKHCPNAYGVSLNYDNKRITYSGDTLPCEELIQLGQKSDLLIHEATMEDGLEQEALTKSHCTVTQAVNIGKRMQVGYTILTHFSQRYSKTPFIEKLENGVGVAFDNMTVSLDDVERLDNMLPVLVSGWKEDQEGYEGRKIKRGRRMLLENSL